MDKEWKIFDIKKDFVFGIFSLFFKVVISYLMLFIKVEGVIFLVLLFLENLNFKLLIFVFMIFCFIFVLGICGCLDFYYLIS